MKLDHLKAFTLDLSMFKYSNASMYANKGLQSFNSKAQLFIHCEMEVCTTRQIQDQEH